MGANGYEIRHGLMSEAKDMLMQGWHQQWEVEIRTSELQQRAPVAIPLPTVKEITDLANEMYVFVQKKD